MAMKKKPRPAISAPMSNKRAEEAKRALKIQAAKKAPTKKKAPKKMSMSIYKRTEAANKKKKKQKKAY